MSWYEDKDRTITKRQWRQIDIPDSKNDVLGIRFRVARNGACVKQPLVQCVITIRSPSYYNSNKNVDKNIHMDQKQCFAAAILSIDQAVP